MEQSQQARETQKRYWQALQLFRGYFSALIEKITDEILDVEDSMRNPYFGPADNLIEKYWHLIVGACAIRGALEDAHASLASSASTPVNNAPDPVNRIKVIELREKNDESPVNDWLAKQKNIQVVSASMSHRGQKSYCTILFKTVEKTSAESED